MPKADSNKNKFFYNVNIFYPVVTKSPLKIHVRVLGMKYY